MLTDEGPRSLLLRSLGETFYRRLVLMQRILDRSEPPNPLGLVVDFLSPDELAEYEALRPGRGEAAARRLRDGERCFGTRLDGELVSVRWLADGEPWVEYLAMRLQLRPGDLYTYDSFTAPAHRGRGIAPASQLLTFPLLAGEGWARTVRAIQPENRAALRDSEKAGYRPCGRVGYVRLGPWRREFTRWSAPCAP